MGLLLTTELVATEQDDHTVFDQLIAEQDYLSAYHLANQMVSSGYNDPEFLFQLGNTYYEGLHEQHRDAFLAINYFEMASDAGHIDATTFLGQEYMNGDRIPQSCNKAIYYLNLASEKGDVSATSLLASDYAQGACNNQDINVALAMLEGPLSQNDPTAHAVMGEIYFFGQGVTQNIPLSYQYYKQAAELGHCDGIYTVGAMYDNGIYVDVDLEKAFNYFEDGSNSGCMDSTVALAHMYNLGRHVKADHQVAYDLYHKAHLTGDHEASSEIGQLLLYSNQLENNPELGRAMIEEAAAAGYDRAQTHLGDLYFHGDFIEQSYKKSAQWYKKAADTDPFAQSALGFLHEYGLGVPLNLNKAERYYLEALDQGNITAIEGLARWYIYGKHFPKDHKKALELLQQGIKTNDPSLVSLYATLLSCSSDPLLRNSQKAINTLNELSEWHGVMSTEMVIAKVRGLIDLGKFDQASLELSEIAPRINDPENLNFYIETHNLHLQFAELQTLVSDFKVCSI